VEKISVTGRLKSVCRGKHFRVRINTSLSMDMLKLFLKQVPRLRGLADANDKMFDLILF